MARVKNANRVQKSRKKSIPNTHRKSSEKSPGLSKAINKKVSKKVLKKKIKKQNPATRVKKGSEKVAGVTGKKVGSEKKPEKNYVTATAKKKGWEVYIIQAGSGALYTGISTDVERRFQEHRGASRTKAGARFFHISGPEKIVLREKHKDRSSATRREIEIKKLKRADKLALIESYFNEQDK